MRYFRANADAYEQARATLNAAWGLPQPGTETSIPPASDCMTDQAGRVYVCVDDWMCDLPPAPDVLAAAIAAGMADEITEAEMEALSRSLPMPGGE